MSRPPTPLPTFNLCSATKADDDIELAHLVRLVLSGRLESLKRSRAQVGAETGLTRSEVASVLAKPTSRPDELAVVTRYLDVLSDEWLNPGEFIGSIIPTLAASGIPGTPRLFGEIAGMTPRREASKVIAYGVLLLNSLSSSTKLNAQLWEPRGSHQTQVFQDLLTLASAPVWSLDVAALTLAARVVIKAPAQALAVLGDFIRRSSTGWSAARVLRQALKIIEVGDLVGEKRNAFEAIRDTTKDLIWAVRDRDSLIVQRAYIDPNAARCLLLSAVAEIMWIDPEPSTQAWARDVMVGTATNRDGPMRERAYAAWALASGQRFALGISSDLSAETAYICAQLLAEPSDSATYVAQIIQSAEQVAHTYAHDTITVASSIGEQASQAVPGSIAAAFGTALTVALTTLDSCRRRDLAEGIRAAGLADHAAAALGRFVLSRPTNPWLHDTAVFLLGHMRSPASFDILVELATSDDPDIRVSALLGIAGRAGQSGVTKLVLESAAGSDRPDVRYVALCGLALSATRALPPSGPHESDLDRAVRGWADDLFARWNLNPNADQPPFASSIGRAAITDAPPTRSS